MLEDQRHGDGRSKNASNGQNGGWGAPERWPELFYRNLVERVPAVLYVDASDESSSTLYMNPQTDSMLGYSRGEWFRDPGFWEKIMHPKDRERVLVEHDRARSSCSPFEMEYRLVARDGSVVRVRAEAALAGDEDRESGWRAGVLLDITDRKRYERELEKSEERFRLVAEVTGEAIWDNDLLTDKQ